MTSILVAGMSPDRIPIWEKTQHWKAMCALPWDVEARPYASHLFEMHDRKLWERRGSDYLAYLQECTATLYMHRYWLDIPASEWYPYERLHNHLKYFNSSIAYMMAWAIAQEPTRIVITGCALEDGEEYAYQRPNMEYLIGYARGIGIEVEVLGKSSLLSFHPNIMFLDEMQTYKDRYGYLLK